MTFSYHWNQYWFSKDGDLSAGFIRIGLSIAALWALFMYASPSADFNKMLQIYENTEYRPLGLLALFGTTPPSTTLLELLRVVAYGSTILSLIGLYSRTSLFISFLSGSMLAAVGYSYIDGSCHGFNTIFITQLAFLLVPGSYRLSVDGYIRRKIKKLPPKQSAFSSSGILLAQFCVAFMYFSAAIQKLRADQFNLGWTSADNLRFHLIRRYPLMGDEIPQHISWIMNNEHVCSILAWANIVNQFLPIVACFLIKWPRLRLALGVAFLTELIGIGIIMNLWDWQMAFLAFVFVDWDYFLGLGRSQASKPKITSRKERTLAHAFVVTIVVAYIAVAFHPDQNIENKINVFPFSNFALYTEVFDKSPLEREVVEIEFSSRDHRLTEDYKKTLLSHFQHGLSTMNFEKTISRLFVEGEIQKIHEQLLPLKIDSISLYLAKYNFPPFPEKYQKNMIHRSLVATFYPKTKNYIWIGSKNKRKRNHYSYEIEAEGYNIENIQIEIFDESKKTLTESPAPLKKNQLSFLFNEFGKFRVIAKLKDGPHKGNEHTIGKIFRIDYKK